MQKRLAMARDQTEPVCLISISDLQPSAGIQVDRPLALSSPFANLPAAVLGQILQLVPQQQRMHSCAAVSQAWKAAATAGTVSIKCNRPLSEAKRVALEAWLRQHGKQLTALSATRETESGRFGQALSPTQLQLPCAELMQLTSLDLSGLQPSLNSRLVPGFFGDPAASSQGTADSRLPKLRELRLSKCTFSNPFSIAQLTQLSGLTKLALNHVSLAPGVNDAGEPVISEALKDGVRALLQRLPHLAQLELHSLQPEVAAGVVAAASSSLAYLTVNQSVYYRPQQSLSISVVSVAQLGALQHLTMRDTLFDPAALVGLSQLQHLHLEDCCMVPAHQPDQAPAAAVAAAAAAATQHQPNVLLEALGSMQKLQHLVLRHLDAEQPSSNRSSPAFAKVQPWRLSALTASSQLTYLDISECGNVPLPPAALQHMFPAGKCLAALQILELSCEDRPQEDECMEVADLQYIVNACPALHSLDLTAGVRAGPGNASALLQLPGSCCSLDVAGSAFTDEAAGVISQLTQLEWLRWTNSPGVSDAGLDQLAALQGLNYFFTDDLYDLSAEVAPKNDQGDPLDDYLEFSANAKPVWQQLRALLDKAPSNITWQRRLEQQQQEISSLKQQVAQLQQRNAVLEEQCGPVQGGHD